MQKRGNINSDRTGGSRRKARVKPPVACFSEAFTPPVDPPSPMSIPDLQAEAVSLGLTDAGTKQVEFILQRTSYQHLSEYYALFSDGAGMLEAGASMKQVHRAMLFDRKLQSLLLEYIGLFELKFRAQYSSALTLEKGPFAHRNPRNFKEPKYYTKFLKTYETEFNRQMSKRNGAIIKAYNDYGDAPTWQAVEIMSFGTLSMLYGNTKSQSVRKAVASSFGLTVEELTSWTRALSEVRNTCAHFGRLVGKNLVARPKRIPAIPGDNGSAFYIILMLIYLLRDDVVYPDDPTLLYQMQFLMDLIQLFADFEDVLPRCGIPSDWIDQIRQKSVTGRETNITEELAHHPAGGHVRAWVRSADGERMPITNAIRLRE